VEYRLENVFSRGNLFLKRTKSWNKKFRSRFTMWLTGLIAVGDVADAYKWLSVLESTEDQYILSSYKVRVEDNPSDEITARNALKLIAEHRQSNILYSFLEGNLYETPLEIGAAYSRLGIDDQSLSEDLIVNVFELRVNDLFLQSFYS